MAIASCSVKIISRGKGRSAVAAAAYRAGEEMQNAYDGLRHNYTRKSGIIYKDILTPSEAPDWTHDRQQLWNMVEQTERRKDAQLAREVMIALPQELSSRQNIELARDYAQRFVEQGMIADVTVHDLRDGNPHAHILLTLRPLEGDSFGKKCREWNTTEKLIAWREQYADLTNRHLERHGHDERIDARSYEAQGIEQVPTVHLGPHAHRMEQKGIFTERGGMNREIEKDNQQLRDISKEIALLEQERQQLKPAAYNYIEHHTGTNEETQKAADALRQRLTRKGMESLSEHQRNIENALYRQPPTPGQDSLTPHAPVDEPARQPHSRSDESDRTPTTHPQPQPEHHERQDTHRASASPSPDRPPPLRRHRENRHLAQQRRTGGNAQERFRQPKPEQDAPVHQNHSPSPEGHRRLEVDELHDRPTPPPQPPAPVEDRAAHHSRHLSSGRQPEHRYPEPDREPPTRPPQPPPAQEVSVHHSRSPASGQERNLSHQERLAKLMKEHGEREERSRDDPHEHEK